MSSPLLVLEAANLFIGQSDKSLLVRGVQLPKIEEIKIPHFPGGALGEISISVGIKSLEVQFSLGGIDPDTMSAVGAPTPQGLLQSGNSNTYNINAALRDKQSNALVSLKATIFGRLALMQPEDWQRGRFGGAQYLISEITFYQLQIGANVIYLFNWATGSFQINNVEQNLPVLAT